MPQKPGWTEFSDTTGSTFRVSTSTRGGTDARWSEDGEEIYFSFANGSGLLVADVTTEPFSARQPIEISDIASPPFSNFDVTADGQRFLVTAPLDAVAADVSDPATATPRIRIVLDWFEELKRLVPVR